LRKAGYAKAFLWVLEENIKARAFYEKMGFALSSESIESNIGGKDLIEVSYVIDLTIESTKALNIF
jgi:ribosomal protein S18 acetylase RimI-like enzyme